MSTSSNAAAEAQVAAEAWEEAALIERLLCIWCTDYAGRGEEWEAHLALAAEYVGRVPAGDVTYQIASEQAHRLTVSSGTRKTYSPSPRICSPPQTTPVSRRAKR